MIRTIYIRSQNTHMRQGILRLLSGNPAREQAQDTLFMISTAQTLANNTPKLEAVDVDMPVAECKSWFMRWSEADYDEVKESARQILSEEEYNHGLQKSDNTQALQQWCSRLAVRYSLSHYVNFSCAPKDWHLVKLSTGKLVLGASSQSASDIDFSLTHVEGMAVCTIARGAAVGVDLERTDRRFKTATIMNGTTFSESEVKLLCMTSARKRSELALKFWTLKEACSKTIGLGLQMAFSDLQFQVSGQGECQVQKITSPTPLRDWKVSQQVFEDDYFLSVAVASPVQESMAA